MAEVKRLIDCTKSDFEKMTALELKESIYKSEGRVIMAQTLVMAGPGMMSGVSNAEIEAAFGADIHAIGDGGYAGCTVPENVYQLSMSIRGRRFTFKRMAANNR